MIAHQKKHGAFSTLQPELTTMPSWPPKFQEQPPHPEFQEQQRQKVKLMLSPQLVQVAVSFLHLF
jgi:hypothetical protein